MGAAQRKAHRAALLAGLYTATQGRRNASVNVQALARSVNVPDDQANDLVPDLVDDGLMSHLGSGVAITVAGIDEVEEQTLDDAAREQLEDQRRRFLVKAYEVTKGNRRAMLNMWELGTAAGLDRVETEKVVDWHVHHGNLERVALGGGIGMTRAGVEYVEEFETT